MVTSSQTVPVVWISVKLRRDQRNRASSGEHLQQHHSKLWTNSNPDLKIDTSSKGAAEICPNHRQRRTRGRIWSCRHVPRNLKSGAAFTVAVTLANSTIPKSGTEHSYYKAVNRSSTNTKLHVSAPFLSVAISLAILCHNSLALPPSENCMPISALRCKLQRVHSHFHGLDKNNNHLHKPVAQKSQKTPFVAYEAEPVLSQPAAPNVDTRLLRCPWICHCTALNHRSPSHSIMSRILSLWPRSHKDHELTSKSHQLRSRQKRTL